MHWVNALDSALTPATLPLAYSIALGTSEAPDGPRWPSEASDSCFSIDLMGWKYSAFNTAQCLQYNTIQYSTVQYGHNRPYSPSKNVWPVVQPPQQPPLLPILFRRVVVAVRI